MKLSIVVPCYNEQESAPKFYSAIIPVLAGLSCDYEIIFVNDGSKDDTLTVLKGLALADKNVKVASFSRNFGQQSAILCGLKLCTGDCCIPIDCDLQDPVEVIPKMVEKWNEGFMVVHGRRISRAGETGFKKTTAKVFYRMLNKMSQVEIPTDTGDFKLLDRRVIDIIVSMPEHNKYLRGLESWVGFKQTFVDFERQERVAGKTNYTLKKMLKLSGDGIFSNSDFPLKFFMGVGLTLTMVSCMLLFAFIFLEIFLPRFNPLWWIVGVIGLIGGLLLVSQGFSNIYLYRVYDEVKCRPEYLIEQKFNFDGNLYMGEDLKTSDTKFETTNADVTDETASETTAETATETATETTDETASENG